MLSFILAFALTERLLPVFNNLLEKDIALTYFGSVFFLWVAVAGVTIGLVSGLYPAIQILKVSPLHLLKTGSNGGKQSAGFRKILVLFQFTVTALLLTVLFIMVGQMNFLKQKDLGFNASAIISVPLDGDSIQSHIPLKQEFLKVTGVEKASVSGFRPGGYAYMTAMDAPNENGKGASGLGGEAIIADTDFLDLMEIKVLWQVRDNVLDGFNKDQVIINKSMAQSMNILENPEEARIYTYNDQIGKEIIAIVDDFHMKSLKDEIEPISIHYLNDWGNDNILLKVETADLKSVLGRLSIPYEQFFGRPFEYTFLDDKIAEFYKKEQGQFKLFQIFSTIALSISLLGLVALTTYSLEQRKKEVSIRKVLGASIQNLLLLLNKEYTTLVVLAFLVASPIAYYAMQGWLSEFKYRIEITPLIFIGAFLSFLFLSWIVTLLQSLKASNVNPADTLRNE
jgi:putative ABC transport system permease protein